MRTTKLKTRNKSTRYLAAFYDKEGNVSEYLFLAKFTLGRGGGVNTSKTNLNSVSLTLYIISKMHMQRLVNEIP